MGEALSRAWRERQQLNEAIEASRESYREQNDLAWSRTYRESDDGAIRGGILDGLGGGGGDGDGGGGGAGGEPAALPAHFDLHRQDSSEERAAVMKAALDAGTAEAEEEMCSVCWVAGKDAVTLPCAHASVCGNCAQFMFGAAADSPGECPVCRGAVEEFVSLRVQAAAGCVGCSATAAAAAETAEAGTDKAETVCGAAVALPCGHANWCDSCAAGAAGNACPVCNETVERVVPYFKA